MFLDFNLARESVLDGREGAPATLGGTLDYMALEHLEALADGLADRVDGRSDIYSLGVLLYEAIMGAPAVREASRRDFGDRGPARLGRGASRRGVPAMSASAPRSPPSWRP